MQTDFWIAYTTGLFAIRAAYIFAMTLFDGFQDFSSQRVPVEICGSLTMSVFVAHLLPVTLKLLLH